MSDVMKKTILAIITTKPEQVGGGSPIFSASNHEELQQKSFVLEKILDGIVHEVDANTMIIVRH